MTKKKLIIQDHVDGRRLNTKQVDFIQQNHGNRPTTRFCEQHAVHYYSHYSRKFCSSRLTIYYNNNANLQTIHNPLKKTIHKTIVVIL